MKQTQTETINDTLADQLAGYYKLFEMSKAQRLIHYLWKYKILFLFWEATLTFSVLFISQIFIINTQFQEFFAYLHHFDA